MVITTFFFSNNQRGLLVISFQTAAPLAGNILDPKYIKRFHEINQLLGLEKEETVSSGWLSFSPVCSGHLVKGSVSVFFFRVFLGFS